MERRATFAGLPYHLDPNMPGFYAFYVDGQAVRLRNSSINSIGADDTDYSFRASGGALPEARNLWMNWEWEVQR